MLTVDEKHNKYRSWKMPGTISIFRYLSSDHTVVLGFLIYAGVLAVQVQSVQ